MKKTLIASAVLLALGGCGGGGGSSSTDNTTTGVAGYSLPTELSAIPASSTNSSTGVRVAAFQSLVAGAAHAGLPADADYNTAQTKKYVEERTLEQFAIIETILNALAQTHYDLPENVGQGPYTAIVAWEEEEEGRDTKTLQPWVVRSDMITENGQQVNRVQVWIEEPDMGNPGQMRTIRAEFKIYRAASVNNDGSYADYGEWDLNVSFADDNSRYFVARSRLGSNGANTIMINEYGAGPTPTPTQTRAIMVRSGDSGYGKVAYPDWQSCWSAPDPMNCTPSIQTAKYVYDSTYLVVDGNGDDSVDSAKERDLSKAVELTQRYGLFYADADAGKGIAAGDDVQKHVNFGFPVTFTDSNGLQRHAYYGAWQGRHELWGGEELSAGTTVSRADLPPGAAAVTYTVSQTFPGTLTRRALADATLSDIQGIPMEIFINVNLEMLYNAGSGSWEYCEGYIDWGTTPPSCKNMDGTAGSFSAFTDFDSLVVGDEDRRFVTINRYDNISGNTVEYVYLNADPNSPDVNYTGPGFYPGQMPTSQPSDGSMPKLEPTGSVYTPSDGDQLTIFISGSSYVEYTGDFTGGKTGWVEKTLQDFDEQNWIPVFDANGDKPFSPELGREYYINNNGTNFIVRRTGTADAPDSYDVMIETQRAANPANVDSFLPPGTAYLALPWEPDKRYSLVTDSTDNNFMMLVFAADDPSTPGDETGQVLKDGQWGLQAYDSNGKPLQMDGSVVAVDSFGIPQDPNVRPVEFNWEYAEGDGWGAQRFLMSDASTYVILTDPIQLDPVTLTNGAGVQKTLSLQYDGWMMGIPDVYMMLAMNDFQISQEIKDKVINIPAGTLVSNAVDGTRYLVKPLEISVFLNEVPLSTAGLPDLAQAASVDLDTVPGFVDHGMGAKPQDAALKYSEGDPVE